jgi:hypothetical protein
VHELPVEFAGWLHERYQRGAQGRYRLSGFDHDLENLFEPDESAVANTAPGGDHAGAGRRVHLGSSSDEDRWPGRAPAEASRATIVYPLDRDRFVLDRYHPDTGVVLRAVCEGPVERLTWFIDGREFAATGPPYEVVWQPDRGPHRVAVAAAGVVGDSVQVMVE